MPNPQLQSYVSQSRATGMSDDQIRQSLQAQGWTEADISEALGMTSVAEPISAGSSGLSKKILIIILAILIAGGAGAYFLLSGDDSGEPMTESKSSKSDIDCSKLLPSSEFERITGYKASDYELLTEQQEPSGQEYKSGAKIISCGYVKRDATYKSAIFGDVTFIITTAEGGMEQAFAIAKNPTTDLGDGKISYGGVTAEVKDGKISYGGYEIPLESLIGKDVPDVGALAFEHAGRITILSDDKKYMVAIGINGASNTLENVKAIARVISSNL